MLVSPLLVNNGQSRTQKTDWSRKQRRTFRNLVTWMGYLKGKGYQLLRVDLTSVRDREGSLTENFKILRRRVERVYKCKVLYFKIETSEGNGVLHMVWAIKSERAVWIPHAWLSAQWRDITGAYVVYIKRVSKGENNGKKIGRYLAQQYLAGQSAIVRVSWSWWRMGISIGKTFTEFYKECRKGMFASFCMGMSPFSVILNYSDILRGWSKLIKTGFWDYGGATFFVTDSGIDWGFYSDVVSKKIGGF